MTPPIVSAHALISPSTLNSPPTRDARGVPLGSSNGAHHHHRSDHHIHVQRAATMGTATLTSEILPPPQLRIHVRVAESKCVAVGDFA